MPAGKFFFYVLLIVSLASCQAVAIEKIPNATMQPTKTLPAIPTSTTKKPILSSITPEVTQTPVAEIEHCAEEMCILDGHFLLDNPISDFGEKFTDNTYRFGSTQGGRRETHHGVEFPNKEGIPVLAVAPGVVVFAGSDKGSTLAWVPNFYGNVVVIRHELKGISQPVYTLYGHLSKIAVDIGQKIDEGKMIGAVGATGTALGSHLHFEVRYAINQYSNVMNPVLWVKPLPGFGVIAGSVRDADGYFLPAELNMQKIEEGVTNPAPYTSILTYENKILPVLGDNTYQENFAAGDLPVGKYRVSVVLNQKVEEQVIEIQDGKLTYLTFVVD